MTEILQRDRIPVYPLHGIPFRSLAEESFAGEAEQKREETQKLGKLLIMLEVTTELVGISHFTNGTPEEGVSKVRTKFFRLQKVLVTARDRSDSPNINFLLFIEWC